MKYEKPELVEMGSAVQSVRGTAKPPESDLDSSTGDRTTISAYEADE